MKEDQWRQQAAMARAGGSAGFSNEIASSESDGSEDEVAQDEREERDELRRDRKRDMQREMRMETMTKKQKIRNERNDDDRDVSEKIALGQAPTKSKDSLFDARFRDAPTYLFLWPCSLFSLSFSLSLSFFL